MKNSGYSIETHHSGRFIIWRITEEGIKLRQGSRATYAEAQKVVDSRLKHRV